MPHQLKGVAFLEACNGRGMLADAMGLGKSATVLSYLRKYKIRAIIVTTKSFLYGWKHEASLWWPEASIALMNTARLAPLMDECDADLILMTYDVMARMKNFTPKATCVVFDESHKVMNAETKRSAAARRLVVGKKHVICLTGTPQPNGRPRQLWHQFLLIGPRFMRWKDFAAQFCNPKRVWAPYAGRHVWTYDGATNVYQLRALINDRFLRRTKDLLNLPPMTESIVNVPVKLKREKTKQNLGGAWQLAPEPWAAYAAKLAAKKIPYALSLVQDCLDRGSKVIVFSNNVETRDAVADTFKGSVKITADMSAHERNEKVAMFQTLDTVNVFCATTQIACEGLTLTAADVVIFLDLPWAPGTWEQAKARAHRTGQKKPVHIYILQADSIYDVNVYSALKNKQTVTEELLDEYQ